MPKATATQTASAAVETASAAAKTAKSLVLGPKTKSLARRATAAAANRGVWLPSRLGRRPVALPEPPTPPSDREVTLTLIDDLGERAAKALHSSNPGQGERSELPQRLVTDRNLAHYLSQAGDATARIADRGAPTGPRWATEAYVDQTAANDAAVNALHQLDHRGTDQRIQLERLEFLISELVGRLERLERQVDAAAAKVAGPAETAASAATPSANRTGNAAPTSNADAERAGVAT